MIRKALLLYNPFSGQNALHAAKQAQAVFLDAGIDAEVAPTISPSESGTQAKRAIARGWDAIFACGGDGTIRDIAEGLLGEDAVLGVIPSGTANVLAHDLGIPLDPAKAARAALRAAPLRVGVGWVECVGLEGSAVKKCFLCVAGVGLDGHLFYKLNKGETRNLKLLVYLLGAFRAWLVSQMVWFSVSASGGANEAQGTTQLLAVRLSNFGGVLRQLAPGASLLRDDLRIVLFKTSSRWRYLLYVLRGIFAVRRLPSKIELSYSNEIRCEPRAGSVPVYVEADGELFGKLPARIWMVPDALTLLAPEGFLARQKQFALHGRSNPTE